MAKEKGWRKERVEEFREQILELIKDADLSFSQVTLLYDIVENLDDWEIFFRIVGKRFH